MRTSSQPAARNLFEKHPRQVLATLDELAGVVAGTDVPRELS